MNIFLINPPGSVTFISPPLGLLSIAAVLEESHHDVFIADFNLERFDEQKLFGYITEKEINVIGISIVTPKVYGAMELAVTLKNKFPGIRIIAGGPHATLMPVQLLDDCPSIDIVIQGEGEFRMRDLVAALVKGDDIEKIDGIAFRKDGRIITIPPSGFINDINVIPRPARHLVDILRYSSHMKTILSPATTMMTSRGCPYKCIYCSKSITGEKLRAMTPENVIAEMEFLIRKYKLREIIFYDDSFTLNKERTMKICDLIIRKGLKIKWQCETRVNLVNEELLKKMKQAGCYLIAYGIESGSENVLKILKKGITKEQVRNAVSMTRRAGIKMIGYFMIGIPGETAEDVKETIRFSKSLDVDFAQYSIATAYPGTELYEIAKAQNKISDDWSKSIYALGAKPLVCLSDIPLEVLSSLTRKAYRSFYFRPTYVFRKITGIRSVHDGVFYLRGLMTLLKQLV